MLESQSLSESSQRPPLTIHPLGIAAAVEEGTELFVCVEGWYQCNLLALTTLLPGPHKAASRQALDAHWGRRLQGRGSVGVGPHNPQPATPRFVRVQVL